MIYSIDQYGVYRKHNPDMSVVSVVMPSADSQDFIDLKTWNETNDLEIYDAPSPPVFVPESVTPRQIRMALNQLNMRDTIENFVDQASWDVKDTWRSSTLVFRNNPFLLQMAPALNLTAEQLDQIFILAATK